MSKSKLTSFLTNSWRSFFKLFTKISFLKPCIEDLSRERIQNYLSGAIFKVNIDNTHPLAYGYENEYYSLKTSSSTYEKLKRGFNVGKIDDDENSIIGFAQFDFN